MNRDPHKPPPQSRKNVDPSCACYHLYHTQLQHTTKILESFFFNTEERRKMKTLNFITGNKNKLSEVRAILGDAVTVDNKSVDVPEIQGTVEEIAKEKCRRAADEVSSH
jgi:Ham1 family